MGWINGFEDSREVDLSAPRVLRRSPRERDLGLVLVVAVGDGRTLRKTVGVRLVLLPRPQPLVGFGVSRLQEETSERLPSVSSDGH